MLTLLQALSGMATQTHHYYPKPCLQEVPSCTGRWDGIGIWQGHPAGHAGLNYLAMQEHLSSSICQRCKRIEVGGGGGAGGHIILSRKPRS